MTPLERVIAALDARDCRPHKMGDSHKALCPSHEDRKPSLHISVGDDGRVLLRCFAGCSIEAVLRALAIDVKELFGETDVESTIIATYPYTDEHGELLYEVVRFFPKDFRQRRPAAKNTCTCDTCRKQLAKGADWLWNLHGIDRVLYRLPQVRQAIANGSWVCVVEGEKDVHSLEEIGQVATTNAGGAGKWQPEYSEQLRGALVAIIRDRDQLNKQGVRVGEQHALAVAEALANTAGKIVHYEPAVGKDITDHLRAGLPMGKLTRPGVPIVRQVELEVLTIKQIMATPTPDEAGNLLGPLVYRGHRVVMAGHTGNGKTSITLQMVAAACKGQKFLGWQGRGNLKALIIDVEQSVPTIKLRIREAGITESDPISYLRVPDGLSLDRDANARAKIEHIFAVGRFDIVLADPLYKLTSGDPNDTQAAIELMRRFDDWRERYEFALLLPMHCRKPHPQSRLSIHDLFGSSGFQWGAEVIMGIERKEDNRSLLHWWKDREGKISEIAPLNSHWVLGFERETGFRHIKTVAKAPRFDLASKIYELIKANDGLTRLDIKNLLWQERKSPTMGQLDTALARLSASGVTHDGQRLKQDRVYRLPDPLYGADDASLA